jgi:peptidoglycan/LPS O-acetylase OafA/YrhL
MRSPGGRGAAEWLIAACGVWHVGLGLYFIFVRPALLPEDIRYIAADVKTLQAAAPHLADWLDKVFTVMGGFMAGAGVLIAYFGWMILPSRPRWATLVLVLAGALTLVLMSAVNFALHSDFRWLLAAPPLVWFAGVWAYASHRPGAVADPEGFTERI